MLCLIVSGMQVHECLMSSLTADESVVHQAPAYAELCIWSDAVVCVLVTILLLIILAPSVAPTAAEPESHGEGDGSTIRATPFINNCVRVMKAISDTQPTVCNALENFANQIFNISMAPERWYEELHAHLIQALKRCYALAFDNKEQVMHAKMTPSMLQYMTTIVRSFGTGVYQEPGSGASSASKVLGDVASEAITKRAQNLLASLLHHSPVSINAIDILSF